MKNGTEVDQGTMQHIIVLEDAAQGILAVQPTAFNLSATESYTTQTVTYTNIGNGVVTNLNITQPDAPITITQNTCASTLDVGASCIVILSSSAAVASSGSGTLRANYGEDSEVALSQYNYTGANPTSGLSLVADDFDFIANTISGTVTKQVTLTNTGNVTESDFVFDFGGSSYFTLSAGTGGTPCTVTNNTVSNILAVNDSCSVTITYTNATISDSSTIMTVNYKYNGSQDATPVTKTLSYETVQATANLGFNPTSPYTFSTIIANNIESMTTEITITNNGSDTVSGNLITAISGSNTFSILPSTGVNDCQTKTNLSVGGTCTLNVRFGPTLVESTLLTGSLDVTGSSATGGSINASLVLRGATRSPVSAEPFMEVAFLPTIPPSGGNGYEESNPIEYPLHAGMRPFLQIKYKNSGNVAATNFVANSVAPTYYNLVVNTCQGVTLESNLGSECEVQYQLNRSSVGNKDIDLSTLTADWTDETGPVLNAILAWDVNGVDYDILCECICRTSSNSCIK